MNVQHAAVTPSLADKVACLSRPETFAEDAGVIELIETHMSFAFLTDRHAYKMKKPVHYPFLDFSTLEARQVDCMEEVRLNRRLARNIYLDAIPLTLASNRLALDGKGKVVEWLVKMRRLPRHLMLDHAIQESRVAEHDIARIARVLALFYRDGERHSFASGAYHERFRRAIIDNEQALTALTAELQTGTVPAIAEKLTSFIDRHGAAFDERVQHKVFVEGHGDLRPEHVCLAAEPVFIDCLEFDRALRMIDPAEELGYLAMESELAGAAWIGHILFDAYRSITGDAPDAALVRFYKAQRALLRAKLAAGHLEDGVTAGTREKWLARTKA